MQYTIIFSVKLSAKASFYETLICAKEQCQKISTNLITKYAHTHKLTYAQTCMYPFLDNTNALSFVMYPTVAIISLKNNSLLLYRGGTNLMKFAAALTSQRKFHTND
jgi:hypothetical protein